jgi:riboflavin kinase/FMN adenylyltransferase
MNAEKRARLARYPRSLPEQWRGGAVAIGNFDGVHLGHEKVLEALRRVAAGTPTIALSFYPHPIKVLRGGIEPRCLSSVREKAQRLGELSIDILYLVHFTKDFARMSATQFIDDVLVRALGVSAVVVGEDVAVGHNREGTRDFLVQELPKRGIALHLVERYELDGTRPGSRAVRSLVEDGDVRAAARLLGAPYMLSARVGHGDKRGAALGFPTANIAVGRRLIPKRGVYACRVEVLGHTYDAVANIGIRPTFSGMGERLEVHLLGFLPQSLYGRRMRVNFIERLRDEKRFGSSDELRAQIAADIESAQKILTHD